VNSETMWMLAGIGAVILWNVSPTFCAITSGIGSYIFFWCPPLADFLEYRAKALTCLHDFEQVVLWYGRTDAVRSQRLVSYAQDLLVRKRAYKDAVKAFQDAVQKQQGALELDKLARAAWNLNRPVSLSREGCILDNLHETGWISPLEKSLADLRRQNRAWRTRWGDAIAQRAADLLADLKRYKSEGKAITQSFSDGVPLSAELQEAFLRFATEERLERIAWDRRESSWGPRYYW
jgi:hypothetical protein